jgi:hypothetical protein
VSRQISQINRKNGQDYANERENTPATGGGVWRSIALNKSPGDKDNDRAITKRLFG